MSSAWAWVHSAKESKFPETLHFANGALVSKLSVPVVGGSIRYQLWPVSSVFLEQAHTRISASAAAWRIFMLAL